MKIICDTQRLTDVCLNVQRCIPTKGVMPHLECILIKTEGTSNIILSGFDLDLGTTTSLDVRIERGGAVCLNAKTFCDILRLLPEDTVTIDCDEKKICTIKSGSAEYTLISLNPEEYPELPTITDETPFRIKASVLREMIRQTIFAVSMDDTKTVHRGVKFELTPGEIKLVALDGFRLAIRKEFTDYNDKPLSFVVPSKTLTETMKLIKDEENFINISIGRRHIIFNIENYCLVSRLLEGEFLNYNSAIPSLKSAVVRINTKEFIDCIERTSVIITEKTRSPIKFIFDDDTAKVSAVTSLGSSNNKVGISLDGKRTEIGFNNRFILDALRSCDTDEIIINLNGPAAPAIILPPEGDSFLFLVLPVKLPN